MLTPVSPAEVSAGPRACRQDLLLARVGTELQEQPPCVVWKGSDAGKAGTCDRAAFLFWVRQMSWVGEEASDSCTDLGQDG